MNAITNFLTGSSPLVYFFIFFGKLIEVSLASLRSLLIHRNQRTIGAMIAILEYGFWITITASALSGFMDDTFKILVLILAFASGNVLGSLLEEKIALGYATVIAVFVDDALAETVAIQLREHGHALTQLKATGIEHAERPTLVMTIKRKHIPHVKKIMFAIDPDVMVSVLAVSQLSGATLRSEK
ncbi:MAG: DUF2179 domain-containing protein [Erysipelothrix sp.]|nr:DUF2179 domain-containing protein [Erysipelothrix sp.]